MFPNAQILNHPNYILIQHLLLRFTQHWNPCLTATSLAPSLFSCNHCEANPSLALADMLLCPANVRCRGWNSPNSPTPNFVQGVAFLEAPGHSAPMQTSHSASNLVAHILPATSALRVHRTPLDVLSPNSPFKHQSASSQAVTTSKLLRSDVVHSSHLLLLLVCGHPSTNLAIEL